MLETWFHELVSGRARGPHSTLARGVLRGLETPYTAAVSLRNRRYDREHDAAQRVGVPVISVGNLTMGGTGKTPMVKWIAHRLGEQGVRVALVSRGYRGGKEGGNDEARELAQSLPDVPHVQDADRVAAARRAVSEFGAEAILLDDGFQHRRIARDLDIVLLDATAPFGHGHVFPRGLLREPAAGLRRADLVCLTRGNLVDADRRDAIRAEAERLAPGAGWCVAEHAPVALLSHDEQDGHDGQRRPVDELRGRRVAAFCAIGNPAAFRATLESAGAEVATLSRFPDHHHFVRAEVERIGAEAAAAQADLLVCTHKDLVKIPAEWASSLPLAAVAVEMRFAVGEDALADRLQRVIKAA